MDPTVCTSLMGNYVVSLLQMVFFARPNFFMGAISHGKIIVCSISII